MKTKLTKKHLDYLVLLLASVVALIIASTHASDKQMVKLTVIAFSTFYVIWGVIHHKEEGSLHMEVIIEYVLFAILGSFLIIGLL